MINFQERLLKIDRTGRNLNSNFLPLHRGPLFRKALYLFHRALIMAFSKHFDWAFELARTDKGSNQLETG